MKPARNWDAIVGLLLGIGGVAVYFLLILSYDPTMHRWLEWPWINLLAVALGLVLSCVGVHRRRARRGRVVAPVAAALNFAVAAAFTWWLCAYSYQIPVAARAPAVGAVAPDFALPNQRGEEVRLSSFRGRSLVLLFYRGFW